MIRRHDLDKLTNLLEGIQKEGIKINRDDELSKVLTDIKGLRTAIYLQTCSGLGYLVDGTFYKSEEDMMKVRNLGRKSLEEVMQKLQSLGCSLYHEDE